MAIDSVKSLLAALKQSQVLDPNPLKELDAAAAAHTDPKAFIKDLVQREWLTPFQANQIYLGNGPELVLGPYILLTRLSEDALGQVFKARHRRMNRLVGLKIIRGELLAKPEAVERFYQETQHISQLSDPHIVHPYDAGPIGQTHFFAMEFVEGVDLETLVTQSGALPPHVAADFIGQAAQGLQHAHERGLVHGDLRPSALLVSRPLATNPGAPVGGSSSWRSILAAATTGGGGALVKIGNFGLTFLQSTDSQTGLAASRISPDYLAPERCTPNGKGDIRSDLYSLGCIYYFLLTGRVVFPGGTAVEKMRRHQSEEPVPVNLLRKDAPPEAVAVIAKLMAKRPQQRYQLPQEAAQALAAHAKK